MIKLKKENCIPLILEILLRIRFRNCLIFLSQIYIPDTPVCFVKFHVFLILGNFCSWRKYIPISTLLRTGKSNYRLVLSLVVAFFFTFSMIAKIPNRIVHIVLLCSFGSILLKHLKYTTFLNTMSHSNLFLKCTKHKTTKHMLCLVFGFCCLAPKRLVYNT
jgi:FlaA1/EpsC-like NDP-sugar epimerase